MHPRYTLSLNQARAVMLATLGLFTPPAKPATKKDVLETIRRLSVLQIDTIHVVNRSHHLVLWSRLGQCNTHWLDELLAERKLFEYWAHAACFLPIEDYPYYRALTASPKYWRFRNSLKWIGENLEVTQKVIKHITKYGPVTASLFPDTRISSEDGIASRSSASEGWWNWKTEKVALDSLHIRGDLTIIARRSFQRVYDLRERGIPRKFLEKKMKLEDAHQEFVERTIKVLGITKKSWIADYFRLPKSDAYPALEKLLDKSIAVPAVVEGFPEPVYFHRDNLVLVEKAVSGALTPTLTTFLSPFDPLVWDRSRARELFNFDYQIESYVPAVKRQYGYFTLPILYKGELIGRMDAKAHRQKKIFEVRSLHFEPSFRPDKDCFSTLAQVLRQFADWHQTEKINVQKVLPKKYLRDFLTATKAI